MPELTLTGVRMSTPARSYLGHERWLAIKNVILTEILFVYPYFRHFSQGWQSAFSVEYDIGVAPFSFVSFSFGCAKENEKMFHKISTQIIKRGSIVCFSLE
jgi:hypothetical protein